MKTRNDLYKEAAELLRVMAEYKVLLTEQVLRLFPGREEKVQTMLVNLHHQRRIWVSQDGRTLKAAEDAETDAGIIKAFWILLDYIDRIEYHCAGTFPILLSFFLDAEFYEVTYIPPDQEALICRVLPGKPEEIGKRIVIVEDAGQIDRLNIPGAGGFCTVSDKGAIQYYKRE